MTIRCPYCDIPVRIDHEGESDEDECHAKQCPHCERTFSYRAIVSIEITDVSQAPCLNDGPHTWQEFRRFSGGSVWRNMQRCHVCGIEEEIKP